jgi:hypothetical protein
LYWKINKKVRTEELDKKKQLKANEWKSRTFSSPTKTHYYYEKQTSHPYLYGYRCYYPEYLFYVNDFYWFPPVIVDYNPGLQSGSDHDHHHHDDNGNNSGGNSSGNDSNSNGSGNDSGGDNNDGNDIVDMYGSAGPRYYPYRRTQGKVVLLIILGQPLTHILFSI